MPLLVGTAPLLAANGLLATLIGVRLTEAGHEPSAAGLVVSGSMVGLVLGSWKGQRIIARVGHIRAFAVFAACATIGTLIFPLTNSLLLWFLARAIAGFCAAGVYLVVESWIGDQTPPERRGVVFAAYIANCQLALVGGQFLVDLYPVTSPNPFIVAAALYAASLVPIALTDVRQPAPPTSARLGVREAWRTAPVAVAGSVVAGVTTGSLFALGPVFAAGSGLDATATAWFMVGVIAGGMVLQWPLGRLSDRVDRRLVVELVGLATGLSSLALWWVSASPSLPALVACGAAIGAFAYVLYPVCLAHLQDLIEPGLLVAASGTLVLVYGLGAAFGGAAGGVVMDAGIRAFPLWILGFNAGLVLLGVVRLLLRRKLPTTHPVVFAPVAHPEAVPASEPCPHPDAGRDGAASANPSPRGSGDE